MRKNPRQQVGERKYCKFLLHHFHQDTSLPLWNEYKRVNPKWMTTYISAKISAVPTSGNSGLCIPKQWRWQGQHPYLLIPDSYSVMLDGLQGKFDKLKIPSPSYHTLTSPGWDNTVLLVQVLPLNCTQNCRSNATRPKFNVDTLCACLPDKLWVVLYLQQLSFSLISYQNFLVQIQQIQSFALYLNH